MKRLYHQASARLLREFLARKYGSHVLVFVGGFTDASCDRWAREIRLLTPGKRLRVVIQTNGGRSSGRSIIVRALSQYQGPTTVHVPVFAWSAGSAVACTADRIVMGEDAVLGPFDPYGEPMEGVFAAVEIAAHKDGVPMSLVRSRNAIDDAVRCFRSARTERRDRGFAVDSATPATDDATIADALICGGWGNHWRPVFLEDAQRLGLAVDVELDPLWRELAAHAYAAVPADDL
jgi:hypothetical protein